MDCTFDDFTESNYVKMIQIAKTKYIFGCYSHNNINRENENIKLVFWRHDVDFSIHRAKMLALIENQLEVRATYFILLSSPYYNIFEKDIIPIINEIINLGHDIGLHFDASIYSIENKNDLSKKLQFEKEIFENLFDIKITSFSFHAPSKFVLNNFSDTQYSGMINTYSDYFKNNIVYCSDSNGYWRFDSLETFLQRDINSDIQVLTHPGWWQKEAMAPRQRIIRSIEGRAKKRTLLYDNHFLNQNSRLNIH